MFISLKMQFCVRKISTIKTIFNVSYCLHYENETTFKMKDRKKGN